MELLKLETFFHPLLACVACAGVDRESDVEVYPAKHVRWADELEHFHDPPPVTKAAACDLEPTPETLDLVVVAASGDHMTLEGLIATLSPLGSPDAVDFVVTDWLASRHNIDVADLPAEWRPRLALDGDEIVEWMQAVCRDLNASDDDVKTAAAASLGRRSILAIARAVVACKAEPDQSLSPVRARLARDDLVLSLAARVADAVADASGALLNTDACPGDVLDPASLADVFLKSLKPSSPVQETRRIRCDADDSMPPGVLIELLVASTGLASRPLGQTLKLLSRATTSPALSVEALAGRLESKTGAPRAFFNDNWVPDSLLDNHALRDLAADLCKDVRLDVTTVLAIAFANRSIADVARLAAAVTTRDERLLTANLIDKVAEAARLPVGFANPALRPTDVMNSKAFAHVLQLTLVDPELRSSSS